jgi:hypothetical protein
MVVSKHLWLPNLFRIWSVLTAVAFGGMLLHQSDERTILGLYSPLVGVLLFILLILTCLLAAFSTILYRNPSIGNAITSRLDEWRKYRWFVGIVCVIAALILVTLWLFFLGNHLPTYGLVRLYFAATVMVFALALIYGGAESGEAAVSIWIGVFVVLFLSIAFVTLSYYPALARNDEATTFSMARNALENGNLGPYIYRHVYPKDYFGGLWTSVMGSWLGVAGISLTSGRIYIFLLGLISLGFLCAAARQLFDILTAHLTLLIGLPVFLSLNYIRYDIHSTLWLSVGIFFYSLAQKQRSWWQHLLAGFAMGMCIDSNPISYCFGLGLGLVYLSHDWKLIRHERRWFYAPFIWIVIGGISAVTIYLVTHSGESFSDGSTTGGMLVRYAEIIGNLFASGQAFSQIGLYLERFLTSQPILFGLMVLGTVVAFRERTDGDRFILIMHFAWLGIIWFVYFYFPTFYIVLGLPLSLLLAARGVAYGIPMLLGSPPTKSPTTLSRLTILLLSVWLTAEVVSDLRSIGSQSLEDVVEVGRQIEQTLSTNSVVVGAEPLYFGMTGIPEFVGGGVESIGLNVAGMQGDTLWSTIAPDVIIFTQGMINEPARSELLNQYMFEQQFGFRSCYQTMSMGRIEVWLRGLQTTEAASLECIEICNPRVGCETS